MYDFTIMLFYTFTVKFMSFILIALVNRNPVKGRI